jgi:hypothetical protein
MIYNFNLKNLINKFKLKKFRLIFFIGNKVILIFKYILNCILIIFLI